MPEEKKTAPTTEEAICVDIDGKVVPCDSPEANMQVAGPGQPIPPKLAARYGLKGRGQEAGEPEPVTEHRSRPLDVSGKAPK